MSGLGDAYTVIDTAILDDGTKLIKMRNPWGSETYHGDWSDDSSLWTDQFKEEAGYLNRDDGSWFISADDY